MRTALVFLRFGGKVVVPYSIVKRTGISQRYCSEIWQPLMAGQTIRARKNLKKWRNIYEGEKKNPFTVSIPAVRYAAGRRSAHDRTGRRSDSHRQSPLHHRCLQIQNRHAPGHHDLDLGRDPLPAQRRGKAGLRRGIRAGWLLFRRFRRGGCLPLPLERSEGCCGEQRRRRERVRREIQAPGLQVRLVRSFNRL